MLMNALQQKPLYKIAIYGSGGTGKTHIGATSPKPLILLFERQGFESVRTAATMMGTPMPPVLWVRSLTQLSRIHQILAADSKEPIATMMRDEAVVPEALIMELGLDRESLIASLPYMKPETVVIDSLTEACDMLADAIDAHGGTETDKSGLTYRKLKAWGPITDKGVKLIRQFRDLPFHVLFICLLNERNHGDEDTPDMRYEPALPGRQLPKKLITAVNALGLVRLSYKRDEDGVPRPIRYVRFITPDTIMTKVANPLREREPADANAWFHALQHKVATVLTPEEAAGLGVDLPEKIEEENEEEGGE